MGEFFERIGSVDLNNAKLVLAISGGADSISMFHLVLEYFQKEGLDKKNIIIAHYNHKFRQESENEAEYLKRFFEDYEFHYLENTDKKFDENSLRKKRYDFFENICAKYENVYLCLGHNLDDRIETMFLNTLRGCGMQGFANMKFADEMVGKDSNIKILRPLIDIPKYRIKEFCEKEKIKYFEDSTNKDISFSKRNLIRNEIISKLVNISNKDANGNVKFYQSWKCFFENIEKSDKKDILLKEITLSKYWEAEYGYKLISKLQSVEDVVLLFRKLGIYKNISQNNLEEFWKFFVNPNAKYKYFQGVYFLNSHGNTYIIKAPKNFWQKKLAEKIKISKIGVYNFGDFNIKIDEQKFIGKEIRFVESGDLVGNKKLQRVLIDNKTPFFWRNFVWVIAEGKQIVDFLKINE